MFFERLIVSLGLYAFIADGVASNLKPVTATVKLLPSMENTVFGEISVPLSVITTSVARLPVFGLIAEFGTTVFRDLLMCIAWSPSEYLLASTFNVFAPTV